MYSDTLYEASFRGILNDEEILQVMIDNELWSMEEETELNSMPVRLDALKVEMYQRHVSFQSRRVEQACRMIGRMRKRQTELARRRHHYDLYTQTGLAHAARLQYIVAHNTKDAQDNLVDLESRDEWFMRQVLEEYAKCRPDELVLRKLAQYGKWRMIWSSGRQEGRVFGVPSTWLTDEQQNLIAWSKLYDNLNEHVEPPPKEVVEDDDMLDGWIICEQKKREKEQRERAGGNTGKQGAQEVFIPAETPEDAQRIDQMNDPAQAFMKRQRMAVLKKNKQVGEQHMPDSKQQISMQAAQQFRERMQKRRR